MSNGNPPPNPPSNDIAFYVVLTLVFLITVGSLGLALWKSTERTKYVDNESLRIQNSMPKGDAASNQVRAYDDLKSLETQESNNQQNTITILMGVFQAGTGAILGLLTGKATSK
jgi:hypothetical protein